MTKIRCIDFDEIWWKDAEDQIFSRYRVQQRALSSKKKFCDFLWKFWPKHPLPGYPKNFLRVGTTRVLFSIKNCTDLDRYQKFCQQSRGSLQLCQLQRRLQTSITSLSFFIDRWDLVGIVSLWYLIDPYQLYWPNQPKNCLIEIFQNAKNLTLAVQRVSSEIRTA